MLRMRFRFLRRGIVILAIISSSAFAPASMAQGQASAPFLTWEELAAHGGLVGLKARSGADFKADVVFEFGRNISTLKAAIVLSPDEWAYFSSNKPQHLLHPWHTNQMDNETWKRTVDLILPNEQLPDQKITVDVDRLNLHDPAVILRRPDSRTIRVYILSANPDGKSGMLFYFYSQAP